MPPTLNIGIPTISSAIGLSVPIRMVPSWNGSNVRDGNAKTVLMQSSQNDYGDGSVDFSNVRGPSSILPVPVNSFPSEVEVNASTVCWMPSISRRLESLGLSGGVEDFTPPFSSPSVPFAYGEDVYGDDEHSVAFAMYRFKVEKCSKQFVHDWKECPFAHEGETARRRSPFTHTSQPCPDFKNNKCCPRGNACPMAHGPWEAGLHPDAYRTNMCAYGHECKRRMCFFAHDTSELRTPSSLNPQFVQQAGTFVPYGVKLPVVVDGVLRAMPVGHNSVDGLPNKRMVTSMGSVSGIRSTESCQGHYYTVEGDQDFVNSGGYLQHMVGCDGEIPLEDNQQNIYCASLDSEANTASWAEVTPDLTNERISSTLRNDTHDATSEMRRAAVITSGSKDDSKVPRKALSLDNLGSNTLGFGMSSAGTNSGDPSLGVDSMELIGNSSVGERAKAEKGRRSLLVNIPARPMNSPLVSSASEAGAGSDSMKQDTSWVDKLLESPIEPRFNIGERPRPPSLFP